MNEGIAGFIGTVLSQIFVGLVLGFCWNNSMTELGLHSLSPVAALSAWFGILIVIFIASFIMVNMFKSTLIQEVPPIVTKERKIDKDGSED